MRLGDETGARPKILAFRPAPVQINYLGYPGTTGADCMDYLIADRTLIPESSRQHYSEKIVYLPDSYQVNDSKRLIAEKTSSRAEEGLPERGFVYCVIATTIVYALILPLIALVPRNLIESADGEPNEGLDQETAAESVA